MSEWEFDKVKYTKPSNVRKLIQFADARIAELEATIERLSVCGTCHMWKPVVDADDTYCCTCIIIGADPACPQSRCDRWAERSTL